MAEQGFILDIDTKFLKNIQQADKELSKVITKTNNLTKSFSQVVQGANSFKAQMQGVASSMSKLGNVDFSSGLAKVNVTTRTAVDSVNLLVANMSKLKTEYRSIASEMSSNKKTGAHLRITSEADLQNIGKLRRAISQINATLGNKSRKKPLTLVEIDQLTRQRDFYKRVVRELNSSDRERTKATVNEVNKQISEIKRVSKAAESLMSNKYTKTPAAAISYAKSAKSLNEMNRAMKYLETVRDRVNAKTERGARTISKINSMMSDLRGRISKVKGSVDSTVMSSDRLYSALSTVFGIQAIRGYINQVVKVRGEFEMQNRALQALLKNKEAANKLWDQTVQLAVRSPFQISQLIRYTKQLAAYRIEQEKLHDTTKMLADISAGVGIDMGRLILAYGQVRAANYLRGTELRQFSEAGINILDDLAKYYTNLEGKVVTVGQVFERVSKRMVKFTDVEKVLKDATSAGGLFYKMQEIQADTLKGSILNFKDKIDLMLNEIGQKNESILKVGVSLLGGLISNYKLLIPILATVTIGFVSMQVAMLKAAIGAKALSAGFASFKAALINPYVLAAVAVVELISVVSRYRGEISKIEKDSKRLSDAISELDLSFNDAFDVGDVKDVRDELMKLWELAKNDFSIDFGLSKEDIQNMDLSELKKKFEELRGVLFDSTAISESLLKAFSTYKRFRTTLLRWDDFARDEDGDIKFTGESMRVDIRQYQESARSLSHLLDTVAVAANKSKEINKEALSDLRSGRKENESDLQYLKRRIDSYEELRTVLKDAKVDTSEVDKALKKYKKDYENAYDEVYWFMKRKGDDLQGASDDVKKAVINSFVTNNEEWDNYTRELFFIQQGLQYISEDEKSESPDLSDQEKESKTLSKRISLIKEMRSEYEKLRKVMGDTAATEEVLRSYQKTFGMAFEGTGISLTDFFRTDEGTIAKLSELSSIAEKEGKEAKISLAREIGQIDVQLRVRSLEKSDKEFIQSIESMFSGYELSLELDKLNIPTSFAKDYFGVDTSSLDDIKNTLYEEKAKEDIDTDRYKKIEEFEKKITDLETKEQKERLKKYLVYARDAVGERAKIKLEELKKLQEIELTFGAQSTPEKQRAVEKVQSDSYQATKKLDWEEFQKSDTFVSLFQDLDMASESLINHALTKLQEFKDSWKDMPHEEMKSIVSQIEKLEMQLIEVSDPFKTARDLRRSLKGGPSLEELQIDRINKETEISGLENELSMLEQIAQLKSEGKDFDADQLAIQNDRVDLFGIESDELSETIRANKEKSSLLATDVKNINKQINDYSKLSKAYQKQAQLLGKARDIAGDLYGAFKDVHEVLGGSDDSMTAIFAEMGLSMMDSVVNCLTLQLELKATQTAAQGAGAAINAALGTIGWAVMAIQILTQAFAAFSKAHDKKIERQIQRIAERVEDLQDRWERLGELMDKVSSSRGIVAYTKEAAENMKDQIEAYNQMIVLEKTKKKTDHDKIKEWEDAQKELRDDYKELIEEGFSTATSGILDDVLGATRGFVDAWHDAFLETGSGVSALHNNFTDLFKDIMRQQAALQIVNPYVNKYKEWLQEYIDIEGGDSELTLDEAREWANKVKSTMPELNNLLSNFFAGTEELMQEQGDLSELSKGIQGVTESTAQILEALLNSMRFFVADTNASVKNIESALMSSDVSRNPILNELQQHTQLIRSIESMFDSVIGHGGSTHTGAYLKVFM